MMGKKKLSRGAAVVGGGLTKLGLFKDRNTKDFFAEAYREMLGSVDKGIDPKDIEAMYIGNFTNDFFVNQAHWAPIISDLFGLVPKPVTRTEGACASSALAFREGVLAIASGLYDIVLVGGFEQMSKRTTEEVAEGLAMAASPYEVAAGFTFPGVFGTMATAYFAKYGADREALFNVTIKSHNNAPLNPKAQFPCTIRDFMNQRIERCRQKGEPIPQWKDEKDFLRDPKVNPPVAWPMHLFDCCPISDGASCLLLVAEDLAKKFTDKPVYVAGTGREADTACMPRKTWPVMRRRRPRLSRPMRCRDTAPKTSSLPRSTIASPSPRSCTWKISGSTNPARPIKPWPPGRAGWTDPSRSTLPGG